MSVKSDAEIEKEIRARLAKSKIGVEKFQVHVQGGVATFEGKTNVIQHKGVATRPKAQAQWPWQVISRSAKRPKIKRQLTNLENGRRRAQIKRGETRSDTTAARQTR